MAVGVLAGEDVEAGGAAHAGGGQEVGEAGAALAHPLVKRGHVVRVRAVEEVVLVVGDDEDLRVQRFGKDCIKYLRGAMKRGEWIRRVSGVAERVAWG